MPPFDKTKIASGYFITTCDSCEWYLQDSNRGHMDFQSIALPPELRHLCANLRVQNYGKLFNLTRILLFFFIFFFQIRDNYLIFCTIIIIAKISHFNRLLSKLHGCLHFPTETVPL